MSELYIFSQDDKLLTIISEDNGLESTFFRDESNEIPDTPFTFTVDAHAEYRQKYNSNNSLTQVASMFIGAVEGIDDEVEINVSPAQFVKEENRVVFKDREGRFREFVIKELDDINNLDGPFTTAVCLPAWVDELSEHYVLDKRYSDKEAEDAMDDALEGTRYEGVVDGSFGEASTNFYRLASVDCVFKITDVWGGEITDNIELDDFGRIDKRKLILMHRLGADRGLRFEIDHNMEEIQRTILSYPKTAMYGYGASLETDGGGNTRYIDFGDVEWKESEGDPVDKPKGQTWVGDPDALQILGRPHEGRLLHRFGKFSNQDYEEEEELLKATWYHLQRVKNPEVNYRLKASEVDRRVELGDTAIAIDREFARPIEIQTRIIAIEYDLLDIEDTTVIEAGQVLDLSDDRIDRIEDTIERDRGNWDNPTVDDDNFPDVKPDTPANVEAVGLFRTIELSWFFDQKLYINYEVYGSQVKDFVPDTQHLLWRGQVSGFSHAVETDQTWYYYIRAVNTHGTASEYSGQVQATTVQIDLPDVENLVPDFLELNIIRSEDEPEGTDYHQGQIWEELNPPDGPNYWHRWSIVTNSWEPISAMNPGDIGAIDLDTYDEDLGVISGTMKELEETAEGITQTVGRLEVQFDGLDVPARNLARSSALGVYKVGDYEDVNPSEESFRYIIQQGRTHGIRQFRARVGEYLEESTDHVISCILKKRSGGDFKITGEVKEASGGIQLVNNNVEVYLDGEHKGSGSDFWESGFDFPDDRKNHRLEIHFTTSNIIVSQQSTLSINIESENVLDSFEIELWEFKIEEGTERTTWLPAPEDGVDVGELTAQITSLQTQIDQTAEDISLRATKTELDTVKNTVSDMEAEIKVNAEEITLRVAKNGVMSAIEQTAEQIKIKAERLDFGDGALIIQNGNVYIRDNVIVDSMIAANARIDFAKIAKVEITNAMIKSLSVDKLTGSIATFTERNWNNISSQVKIRGSGLETFSGSRRTSVLNGSGHQFYRDNYMVGRIGTAGLHDYPNLRGLNFQLANDAYYMAWSHLEKPSDNYYTIKMAWYKNKQAYDVKGFNFNDDVKINGRVRASRFRTEGYTTNRNFMFVPFTWNGYSGVALRRASDGAKVFIGRSRAALINEGNAYVEVGTDSTGNYVRSTDIGNRTYTSTSRMVRITQYGTLGRSTSSRRYKLIEEVLDLSYARRILSLNPKSWYDKRACEDYASTLSDGTETEGERIDRVGGLIAEDLHDVGLGMYVTYDERGRPDGISENVVSLLIPIVRNHDERIASVELTMNKHEQRINLLEKENKKLKNKVSQLEELVA